MPKSKASLHLLCGNRIFMFLLLAVFVTFIWINCAQINATSVSSVNIISHADYLVLSREGLASFGLVSIPIFILFSQINLYHDFDASFVIRSHSRSKIWHMQCVKIMCYSLLMSAFFVVNVWLSAYKFSSVLINWHSPFSSYYSNLHVLNYSTTFWHVMLATFVSCLLTFLGFGLIFLALCWGSNQPVLAWVAVLGTEFWDYAFKIAPYLPDGSLLFLRTSISYYRWHTETIPENFVIAGIVCVILYLIGRYRICEGKEFYQ